MESDNYLIMNVNHVQWENDSLVLYFSKTKGDQSGDKSGDIWNVYLKPKNPELCPVVAMTKHLLSRPYLLNGNYPLLPGKTIRPLHKNISQGYT